MTRARYPSYCQICGGPIHVGDAITEHAPGWAHITCQMKEHQ